ncbi:MAG: hypothetical protein IMY72_14260 [Bacteroidetes bacterium]|nr:hypothetical protein [Bacteroidota bacterium]
MTKLNDIINLLEVKIGNENNFEKRLKESFTEDKKDYREKLIHVLFDYIVINHDNENNEIDIFLEKNNYQKISEALNLINKVYCECFNSKNIFTIEKFKASGCLYEDSISDNDICFVFNLSLVKFEIRISVKMEIKS